MFLLYWKLTTPPPVSVWLSKVNEIKSMEDVLASSNTEEHIYKNWFCWINLTCTSEYQALMAHPAHNGSTILPVP